MAIMALMLVSGCGTEMPLLYAQCEVLAETTVTNETTGHHDLDALADLDAFVGTFDVTVERVDDHPDGPWDATLTVTRGTGAVLALDVEPPEDEGNLPPGETCADEYRVPMHFELDVGDGVFSVSGSHTVRVFDDPHVRVDDAADFWWDVAQASGTLDTTSDILGVAAQDVGLYPEFTDASWTGSVELGAENADGKHAWLFLEF